MNLYGQEAEARLLGAFLPRLDNRVVIDVGAERGAFAEEMLRAGSDAVHLIEPEPTNATFLRTRFGGDKRVKVHEYAVNDRDGDVELQMSVDPEGAPISFGHTLLRLAPGEEIEWMGSVRVRARSLGSLIDTGEVPSRVGILKVDTEGKDLSVMAGIGQLECDVVMVEHWRELPKSLGPCPWTIEEMLSILLPRGFTHFAFVAHRPPFVFLKWDDAEIPDGDMGNIVFLHEQVLDRLYPVVLQAASVLAEGCVEDGEAYGAAAAARLAAMDELRRELDTQSQAASDRLGRIEGLEREREVLTQAADERLALIKQLRREYQLLLDTRPKPRS